MRTQIEVGDIVLRISDFGYLETDVERTLKVRGLVTRLVHNSSYDGSRNRAFPYHIEFVSEEGHIEMHHVRDDDSCLILRRGIEMTFKIIPHFGRELT